MSHPDSGEGPMLPLRMTLVQMDSKCEDIVRLLRVPIGFTLVLMFLLVYSGRLLDSFFCLLSLALYYLCTRERDHCNFTCLILLFVMSCTQLFFSSFRLLMLLVGTADEMAPPESKTKFAVFAIGAVAVPVIHLASVYYSWCLYQQLRYTMFQLSVEHGAPDEDADAHSAVAPASPALVLSSPAVSASAAPLSATSSSGTSETDRFKAFSGVGHRLDGDSEV